MHLPWAECFEHVDIPILGTRGALCMVCGSHNSSHALSRSFLSSAQVNNSTDAQHILSFLARSEGGGLSRHCDFETLKLARFHNLVYGAEDIGQRQSGFCHAICSFGLLAWATEFIVGFRVL